MGITSVTAWTFKASLKGYVVQNLCLVWVTRLFSYVLRRQKFLGQKPFFFVEINLNGHNKSNTQFLIAPIRIFLH